MKSVTRFNIVLSQESELLVGVFQAELDKNGEIDENHASPAQNRSSFQGR
jgi:hypothetical protein